MKKLLIILLLTGCTKVIPTPSIPSSTKDIFSVSQNTVSNGADIMFQSKIIWHIYINNG